MESSPVTATTLPAATRTGSASAPSGLAHVATASFLASRAAPSAGFWLALAGGVALARAGQVRGIRAGYGASIAAMLQTVAVMGPARFGVPLTQALSAPLLGRLEARGTSVPRQLLACGLIRLVHTTATVAAFAFVLAGGIGAYTDGYDGLARHVPLLPEGTQAALIFTGAGLLLWAAFASTVQVLVYRRGLHLWTEGSAGAPEPGLPDEPDTVVRRFDPRAIALAAAVAFCLLLSSTTWGLLVAVSAWLAIAWLAARGDREVLPAGLLIALSLAGGVFAFALMGGIGLSLALRRAARAALLVMVATWLRSAAGSGGLREVSRRVLRRLERVPSVREASLVLDELGSGRELGVAARTVVDGLRSVRRRPLPLLDAVLRWVASESARFRAAPRSTHPALSARPADLALVTAAALPLLALIN